MTFGEGGRGKGERERRCGLALWLFAVVCCFILFELSFGRMERGLYSIFNFFKYI